MSRRERTHDPVEHHRAAQATIGGLFAVARDLSEQHEHHLDPDWLIVPRTSLERRFAAFHARNKNVYAELERLALAELAAGATWIGVGDLAERLRRGTARTDTDFTTAGDDYKVNNSYRSLVARLLVHRNPQLRPLIELRQRKERGAA